MTLPLQLERPSPLSLSYTGQVGYITCGMKSTKEARVGETLHAVSAQARTPPDLIPPISHHLGRPLPRLQGASANRLWGYLSHVFRGLWGFEERH